MSSFKTINVAIIGCGKIAEKHATILTSKKIEQFNLVAVCDINKKKAKNFGKKFNINFFYNIDILLKSTDIDLVVICTSSGHHFKNAMTVSKYKKNIVIEKPICLDLLEAQKIVKIYNKNKNMLFVVMQNRLNPLIKLLKEVVEKNLLGKISSLSIRVWWCRDQNYYDQAAWRGTWKSDGGIFMNQGIHHLDMMTWLMGPVNSLVAMIKKRLVKIQTEDVGTSILDFKNGVLGTIEVSTALRPQNFENSITVLGECGNIKIGGLYMNDLEVFNLKNKMKGKILLKKYKKNKDNNHYLFYQNVFDNISKRNSSKKKYIDGNEAIKSLEIVHGIYQSIIKKRRIYFPIKPNVKNNTKKLIAELKN
jgi:UDP-N-acetyl-2-amino-2-deoxyglucuronate dehydrogenase